MLHLSTPKISLLGAMHKIVKKRYRVDDPIDSAIKGCS